MQIEEFKQLLTLSWKKETCLPKLQDEWKEDNSSLGQCAITTLIVNDFFGGKIMKCMTSSGSHYYNLINNQIVDLTIEQFLGRIPAYNNGEERTRECLLNNEDTKKRYLLLLKKLYKNFCDYSFEKINNDKRIDKEKLKGIAFFSTFEIDSYEENDEYEELQFDLAAQDTGNIYRYRHIKKNDKYILIDKSLYTLKDVNYDLPKKALDAIFIVAKENKQEIDNIKLLRIKLNS